MALLDYVLQLQSSTKQSLRRMQVCAVLLDGVPRSALLDGVLASVLVCGHRTAQILRRRRRVQDGSTPWAVGGERKTGAQRR